MYHRDPNTRRSPPELGEVHRLAKAPVVEVDGHKMVESGAIIEYLVEKHSDGALGVAPDHAGTGEISRMAAFCRGHDGDEPSSSPASRQCSAGCRSR